MSADHAFSGSIPENYNRYLVPMIFEDYARELASRTPVAAGSAVLETACGTGVATRHLLDRLPSDATLVSTDLQAPMVEFTKAAVSDARLTTREADAGDLPFEDGSFDAVASAFGVMFFPDRDQAYREVWRVLKPGGTFVTSIWDSLEHNSFARIAHETLGQSLPENPPMFLTIAFGHFDLNVIDAELQAAGFRDIEILIQQRPCRCASATDVSNGFLRGNPVSLELGQRGADIDSLADTVTEAVVELYGPTDCESSMQAFVVSARRPALRDHRRRTPLTLVSSLDPGV